MDAYIERCHRVFFFLVCLVFLSPFNSNGKRIARVWRQTMQNKSSGTSAMELRRRVFKWNKLQWKNELKWLLLHDTVGGKNEEVENWRKRNLYHIHIFPIVFVCLFSSWNLSVPIGLLCIAKWIVCSISPALVHQSTNIMNCDVTTANATIATSFPSYPFCQTSPNPTGVVEQRKNGNSATNH